MAASVWTGEDIAEALSLYFTGWGFKWISVHMGRTQRAIEDLILDDIPRNYRGVIDKIVRGELPSRDSLTWNTHEIDYVCRLWNKKRSQAEISKVLDRSWQAIEAFMNQMVPVKPSEGFFTQQDKKEPYEEVHEE